MKTNLKWRLLPVGIGLITLAAFVGSISGSLAWWAYSTRVSVTYQGTSVTTSAQLQIGLRTVGFEKDGLDDPKGSALTTLGLEEDTALATTEGGKSVRYFFAKAGAGLPANAISEYLTQEGIYATNELVPVTSRNYDEGDTLSLYNTLVAGHQVNENEAEKNKYVEIPFVFRIVKMTSSAGAKEYIKEQNIWLTDVEVEASSSNPNSLVHQAIRAHFYSEASSTNFVLNPSDRRDEAEGGESLTDEDFATVVAGCLDLNKDQKYDVDDSGKEIVYGDYTGTATAATLFTQTGSDSALANINDVTFNAVAKADENSTFYAKHGLGNTCYSDYSELTLEKAYYKTIKSIAPEDHNGRLSGGTPLCQTANDANGLANLTMKIWLEGWDHAVIDEELSHAFNLGLQFQINLVS